MSNDDDNDDTTTSSTTHTTEDAPDNLILLTAEDSEDGPDNVIPWRWSTRPKIDSDNPEHADQIRDDPASLADDIILALCLARHGRGEPLGELEHLQVEDIKSITIRGEEVTIELLPGK